MKTIRFYSYKGGVGRTLLTAHIARLLAALGKKIVVMDFDFTAPGVPGIFGKNAFKMKGGVVDLIKFLINAYYRHYSQKDFCNNIKKYLVKVPVNSLRGGEVKILPCGSPQNVIYWEQLTEIEKELLKPDMIKFSFKGKLIRELSRMGFDYLLIDATSGITCYGDISRCIADSEVVIFCPNKETEYTISPIFCKLNEPKRVSNLPEKSIKTAFVVSRIPPELKDEHSTFEKFKELLKKECKNLQDILGIFPLHSDLQTHLNPQKRFEFLTKKSEATLVHYSQDVFNILYALCPEARNLWKDLTKNKSFEIELINHIFEFNNDHGVIINADDGQRNVAFKVKTFLRFLDIFFNESSDKKKFNDTLYKIGEQCGKTFGKDFVKSQLLKGKNRQEKIHIWCEFDSRAGFGKLSFFEKNNMFVVENLFLRAKGNHKDYTAFFTGYATGVLQAIIPQFTKLERDAKNEKPKETKYRIRFKSEGK